MRISDWSSDVCSSDLIDTIVGGDGNDTLVLGLDAEASVGHTGASVRGFNTTNMTGIESIVLETGFDAVSDPDTGDVAGWAQTHSILVDPASIAAGDPLGIAGSALQTGLVTDLGSYGILGAPVDFKSDEPPTERHLGPGSAPGTTDEG